MIFQFFFQNQIVETTVSAHLELDKRQTWKVLHMSTGNNVSSKLTEIFLVIFCLIFSTIVLFQFREYFVVALLFETLDYTAFFSLDQSFICLISRPCVDFSQTTEYMIEVQFKTNLVLLDNCNLHFRRFVDP